MSEQFEGMCCQIALDQCNNIFNDSNGTRGWLPTVCPHGPNAAKIIGRDPYREEGGGGKHTNCDAYKEYTERKKMLDLCVALHELEIPDLQLYMIFDELHENDLTLYQKWLITRVAKRQ